jgi:hypothetical protein
MPSDTFYFMPPEPWISAPGEVTHIVALLANAERKEMLIYIELLNAACVGVLLPYTGVNDAQAAYAVDVLRGIDVQATVNDQAIADVPWRTTHQLGDGALNRFAAERIGRLIGISQERAWQTELEALTTRAFGVDQSRPITHADLASCVSELVDFVLLEWKRPLTTVHQMEDDLRRLGRLCSQFEQQLRPSSRSAFTSLIASHRARLAKALEMARASSGQI